MNDLFPSKREFWDLGRRFFDDALGENMANLTSFKTDIIEKEDAYIVEAELPGMSKDDIELDYHDNILTIRGRQETEKNEQDEERKYVRRERSSRSFSRQFIIQDIDEDAIKAKFDNGILEINLPKIHPTPTKSTKIDIE
ncbi:heat shock protein, Hsp20 family [Alkalibacterium sp. AK22]|uniref:Hsp20/alpha crystallin family protein n=1 Tax=Alkalibacterium sp. AK22 TaxID=1229520 RepID=UPI0004470509|nr:Hsp20/alpha crystallin family protein [Alkalibacterium sp. AK22]EXJ24400.1 heat shock protein, Hsp20 family [Alkalibacterium sp. AK22]